MRMRASSQRGGCPLSYSRVRASEPTGRHSRRACGGCFGEVLMNAPDRWVRLLGPGPEDWSDGGIASVGRAGGGGFAPVLRCDSLREASEGAFDRVPFCFGCRCETYLIRVSRMRAAGCRTMRRIGRAAFFRLCRAETGAGRIRGCGSVGIWAFSRLSDACFCCERGRATDPTVRLFHVVWPVCRSKVFERISCLPFFSGRPRNG